MKHLVIAFALILLPTSSWALREVEFEWEEVPNAKQYQVEIKNQGNFLKRLISKSYNFKIRISAGRYQIRGRVHGIDPQDTNSDWSEWKSFDVPPSSPKPFPLEQNEFKVSPKTFMAEIQLKWPAAEGATSYLLEIFDINKNSQKSLAFKKPEALLNLRPGYYTVTLKSRTADDLESEPTVLAQQIVVQNIPLESPQKLSLQTEQGLLTFDSLQGTSVVVALERQSFLGKEWTKIEQKVVVGKSFQWTTPLKPGKYRLTLFSKNSFDEVSKPVYKEFVIKPKEKDLPQ